MRKALLIIASAAALGAASSFARAQDPGAHPTNLNASITLEQKQHIRDVVLKQHDVPRVARVDFALTIGNVVPQSVQIAPVPQPVVDAFPAWRGYACFVLHDQVQDQIIMVNPQNHTIVAIIG